jgi:hypothetical protein
MTAHERLLAHHHIFARPDIAEMVNISLHQSLTIEWIPGRDKNSEIRKEQIADKALAAHSQRKTKPLNIRAL